MRCAFTGHGLFSVEKTIVHAAVDGREFADLWTWHFVDRATPGLVLCALEQGTELGLPQSGSRCWAKRIPATCRKIRCKWITAVQLLPNAAVLLDFPKPQVLNMGQLRPDVLAHNENDQQRTTLLLTEDNATQSTGRPSRRCIAACASATVRKAGEVELVELCDICGRTDVH